MNSLDKAIDQVCKTYGLAFRGFTPATVSGKRDVMLGFTVELPAEFYAAMDNDEDSAARDVRVVDAFLDAVAVHLKVHIAREVQEVLLKGKV